MLPAYPGTVFRFDLTGSTLVLRLRTIAIAVAVIAVTDVTWDGASLHVSFGWPRRKPIASFELP